VDFRAERALLAIRFGEYGLAAPDLSAADAPSAGRYAPLAEARAVVEAVPPDAGALYQEYVVDAVIDRAPGASYAPRPGHVLTILEALAPGGTERQAVSVVEALSRDGRVTSQLLLVERNEPEPNAFFLPRVERAGLPVRVFGGEAADVDAVAAALGDAALAPLLRSLPAAMREAVCRLVPIIRSERPAAVHVRRDFTAAALACRLAGVPRVVLGRGVLAPTGWNATRPQRLRTIRPMRQLYRRLLEGPGFTLVNNSAAGVASDREWLDDQVSAGFRVVPNTLDLGELGRDEADGASARAASGVPADALLIGGAFRLHRSKRPTLWLRAARLILDARPDAFFLIIGEGEERGAVERLTDELRLTERLRLPGAVAEVGRHYRTMDLALLVSEREGLPNMLIEAQHFGVPVVSTDVCGARETMEPGTTGRLVPADADARAIADAVLACVGDPAWMGAARARAPALARDRFGAGRGVDALVELYGLPR
jgi:glycosyltransferase involved in cell wall biosynthesis